MTEQTSAPARRKTQQAIKISASWTPSKETGFQIADKVFGKASPLDIRGGRLTINAAVALDMTDPANATRAAARVAELRKELEAVGTVHSFVTTAGAVPFGEAECLPEPETEGGDE